MLDFLLISIAGYALGSWLHRPRWGDGYLRVIAFHGVHGLAVAVPVAGVALFEWHLAHYAPLGLAECLRAFLLSPRPVQVLLGLVFGLLLEAHAREPATPFREHRIGQWWLGRMLSAFSAHHYVLLVMLISGLLIGEVPKLLRLVSSIDAGVVELAFTGNEGDAVPVQSFTYQDPSDPGSSSYLQRARLIYRARLPANRDRLKLWEDYLQARPSGMSDAEKQSLKDAERFIGLQETFLVTFVDPVIMCAMVAQYQGQSSDIIHMHLQRVVNAMAKLMAVRASDVGKTTVSEPANFLREVIYAHMQLHQVLSRSGRYFELCRAPASYWPEQNEPELLDLFGEDQNVRRFLRQAGDAAMLTDLEMALDRRGEAPRLLEQKQGEGGILSGLYWLFGRTPSAPQVTDTVRGFPDLLNLVSAAPYMDLTLAYLHAYLENHGKALTVLYDYKRQYFADPSGASPYFLKMSKMNVYHAIEMLLFHFPHLDAHQIEVQRELLRLHDQLRDDNSQAFTWAATARTDFVATTPPRQEACKALMLGGPELHTVQIFWTNNLAYNLANRFLRTRDGDTLEAVELAKQLETFLNADCLTFKSDVARLIHQMSLLDTIGFIQMVSATHDPVLTTVVGGTACDIINKAMQHFAQAESHARKIFRHHEDTWAGSDWTAADWKHENVMFENPFASQSLLEDHVRRAKAAASKC